MGNEADEKEEPRFKTVGHALHALRTQIFNLPRRTLESLVFETMKASWLRDRGPEEKPVEVEKA